MKLKKLLGFAAVLAMVLTLLVGSALAATADTDVVLPEGVSAEDFGTNTVTDGENYYATMKAALEGIHKTDKDTLWCKPGADVGSLTHGHVCSSLTVFGNGAYISGGEQEFELDLYKYCHNGSNTCDGLTGDVTLTVKSLNGSGAWGGRTTENTINLVFENCKDMSRIYFTGTTGVNNVTLTNCTFTSNNGGNCKVYTNANGTVALKNCTFSDVALPINLNHKVAGAQIIDVVGCTFTNCGIADYDYAAPVRVLSSVKNAVSDLTVADCTFTGTVANSLGQDADILLDYGIGTTCLNLSGTAANVLPELEKNIGTATAVGSDETLTYCTSAPNADLELPEGMSVGSFGANTVTDGENFYATLAIALQSIHNTNVDTLWCRPGADVGSMTHGHVCSDLTVYGNGAYISGGEQEFELDTYKYAHVTSNACEGLTEDVTLTVKSLNGSGAWGERKTANTINLVFEDCKDMSRIYFTGVTGESNVTLIDCTFTSNITSNCKVYTNANGSVTLTNVDFSNVGIPVNLNHKVAGKQTILIEHCTFTNCGTGDADYAAPVRVLATKSGAVSNLTVVDCTFTDTVANSLGQDADILLDYGIGYVNAEVSGTAAKIIVEELDDVGTATTITADDTWTYETKFVAQIGDTQYKSLAAAFAGAQAGDTIVLLDDVTLTEGVSVYDAAVLGNITLDGDDHTITLNMSDKGVGLRFGGTSGSKTTYATGVKIQDLTITGSAQYAIWFNGGTSSELTNVTISGTYDDFYGALILYGTHGATLTNCTICNGFVNGSDDNPLYLVNSTIGTLFANGSQSADDRVKVYVDNDSHIDEVTCGSDCSIMIDPNSRANIGTIKLYSGDVAADINGVLYTLNAAVNAVEDGGTIELLQDVALRDEVKITKKITINGNGKTIKGCEGYEKVTLLRVTDGGDLTLGKGLTVDAPYIAVFVRGGKLTTSADLIANDVYAALQTNGNDSGNDVTVLDGTIKNVGGDAAIYWPSEGSLTISGGTIQGATGIYFKSGSLTITGGTIIGNGEKKAYNFDPSGCSVIGEALTIENVGADTGYEAIEFVSITGGRFISVNSKAVGSYTTADDEDGKDVNGSDLPAGTEYTGHIIGFISGGNYSNSVAQYASEDMTDEYYCHALDADAPYSCAADNYETFIKYREQLGTIRTVLESGESFINMIFDFYAEGATISKNDYGVMAPDGVLNLQMWVNCNNKTVDLTQFVAEKNGCRFLGWTDSTGELITSYTVTGNETASLVLTAKFESLTPAAPSIEVKLNDQLNPVVSWNTVENATSYKIFRSTGSGYAQVAEVTTTSWTDTDVTGGITYFYKVKASNNGNDSALSAFAAVRVPHVPATPVISVTARSGQPVVSWEKVAYASEYAIYRKAPGESAYSLVATVTETSWTDVNVTPGYTYYYKVKAINNDVAESALSAFKGVKVPEAEVTPDAPVISVTARSGQPVVSWSAVEHATSYNIYRKAPGGSAYALVGNVTGTSYTDVNVVPGSTYYYKVTAVNGKTESAMSSWKGVKVPAAEVTPDAPVISVTATSGYPVVSWSAVEHATSYNIYRKAPGESAYGLVANVTGTSYTDVNVASGSTYYYKVTAVNGSKESAMSNWKGVKVPTFDAPDAPVISVTARSGQPVVSWDAVENATSYNVYRKGPGESGYTLLCNVTGTSYTDTGAQSGSTYYYKVTAVNGNVESGMSNWAGVKVP